MDIGISFRAFFTPQAFLVATATQSSPQRRANLEYLHSKEERSIGLVPAVGEATLFVSECIEP